MYDDQLFLYCDNMYLQLAEIPTNTEYRIHKKKVDNDRCKWNRWGEGKEESVYVSNHENEWTIITEGYSNETTKQDAHAQLFCCERGSASHAWYSKDKPQFRQDRRKTWYSTRLGNSLVHQGSPARRPDRQQSACRKCFRKACWRYCRSERVPWSLRPSFGRDRRYRMYGRPGMGRRRRGSHTRLLSNQRR